MTPGKRALLVGGLVLAIIWGSLAAIWYGHIVPEPPAAAPTTGTAGAPLSRFAPIEGDFTVVATVDGKGQPSDMAPYGGKVLLVNLWATWCAPCIKELPSLGALQQELGGDQFQVVTIAVDERDPAKIEPFLAQHGAGNLPVLIDRDRTIDKVAQVSALPTSLLVDRDGKAKAMVTGDACWNSGTALAAVKAFISDGTVMTDELNACE